MRWLRSSASPRASIPRIILGELVLELLHGRDRIDADLADVVGPGLLQRLSRLLPLCELGVGERIDLVARLCLYLGYSIVLELAPGAADFAGKIGGAIVIDRLL